MAFLSNKRVLVAGGTGMIGIPLVEMLVERGAKVRVVSLDDPSRAHKDAEFHRLDMTSFDNCMKACEGMDYVFNLLGVKGSPAVTTTKPASMFVPTITFDTAMMEAARRRAVGGFLFSSSIAVYQPAERLYEDSVWSTFPSPNDRFAGWAKRIGELQADAYRIEHGWKNIDIVRPANVYGPHDNFDRENAMVVPSLIRRAVEGQDPLKVWGDGSAVRDFIHARDCARGMLVVAEKNPGQPVNLGSGQGVRISELVEAIAAALPKKPRVEYDASKPRGDARRVLDTARAESLGFAPQISLKDGVAEVVEWYRRNRERTDNRYDVFA